MRDGGEKALQALTAENMRENELCSICFTNQIILNDVTSNAINEEREEESENDREKPARTLSDGKTFEFT